MTPADYCRSQGWQVGDVLEDPGRNRIVIIAICRTAVVTMSPAIDIETFTLMITLEISTKVGHMDPFADELVWPE